MKRNKLAERARQSRRNEALSRPELRGGGDGIERRAAAGPTSPPIKQLPPDIEKALEGLDVFRSAARKAGFNA